MARNRKIWPIAKKGGKNSQKKQTWKWQWWWNLQIALINILDNLKENINIMREMEDIKITQWNFQRWKMHHKWKIMKGIKNRLKTAKGKITELEDIAIKTIQKKKDW